MESKSIYRPGGWTLHRSWWWNVDGSRRWRVDWPRRRALHGPWGRDVNRVWRRPFNGPGRWIVDRSWWRSFDRFRRRSINWPRRWSFHRSRWGHVHRADALHEQHSPLARVHQGAREARPSSLRGADPLAPALSALPKRLQLPWHNAFQSRSGSHLASTLGASAAFGGLCHAAEHPVS